MSRANDLFRKLHEQDSSTDYAKAIVGSPQPVIAPPPAEPIEEPPEVEVSWEQYDGEPAEDEDGRWTFKIGDTTQVFTGPYSISEWNAIEVALNQGIHRVFLTRKN